MRFLTAILAIGVTGAFFVLEMAWAFKYRFSVTEFFSMSFFTGIGIITCQLFLFHILGIDLIFSYISLFPIVLLLMTFSRYVVSPVRLKKFLDWGELEERWRAMELFLIAAIVIQVLWTVLLVLPVPVHSHDAVANYALKAKIFYSSGGIPGGFFGWSESTVAHPDYPLLLPLLLTWIHIFTGFNDFSVNMIMPIIYMSFICLFYSQIRHFFNRAYSILTVFILATIPQLFDYALIIHADLILTALITCAFTYFIIYVRKGDRVFAVFSSILFGFALWTKNEAIVFTAAFAVVFAVFTVVSGSERRKRVICDMLISFLIIALIAAPWFILKLSSASANSDINISMLTVERLWQNVRDIPILLNLTQQEVFGPKKWNIFWVLLLAAMVWKRRELFKGECLYIILFLVLAEAGYFCAYMVTTGNNLFFYVNTTISRFMLHFSGVSALLLSHLVYKDIKQIKSFAD